MGIKLRILVTPIIIFLFGAFAALQLLSFGEPCTEHLIQKGIGGMVGLVQAQIHFPIHFTYFQSIHIFQCEKGVHKANIGIDIWHGKRMGADIKEMSYVFYKLLLWYYCFRLILCLTQNVWCHIKQKTKTNKVVRSEMICIFKII